MSCTYSPEENEQVSEWFLQRSPNFQPVEVPHLAAYQSHLATIPCYRTWPQTGLVAGAFAMLFQNQEIGQPKELPAAFFQQAGFTHL